MSAEKWEALVRKYYDFLFLEDKFTLFKNVYDTKSFGNRITILRSREWVIKMNLDRGCLETWVEHRPSKRSKPLYQVLKEITLKPASEFSYYHDDEESQLKITAEYFKKYKDEIFNNLKYNKPKEINTEPFLSSEYNGKEIIYAHLEAYDPEFRKSLKPGEFKIGQVDDENKEIAIIFHTEATYLQALRDPKLLNDAIRRQFGEEYQIVYDPQIR
jgi:hypothetical protein